MEKKEFFEWLETKPAADRKSICLFMLLFHKTGMKYQDAADLVVSAYNKSISEFKAK